MKKLTVFVTLAYLITAAMFTSASANTLETLQPVVVSSVEDCKNDDGTTKPECEKKDEEQKPKCDEKDGEQKPECEDHNA
ncbi:hypothetical protein [Planctobacterium marinum]|uniref:hypothetical protein n=1 Tax=Planctobacterium marinum TaxID=1631968 RepID=UPI001E35BEA2|nr:hypothetical protein [Planctobacterium marinum]MCC2603760.1 hypothetical protein [Planctobacterium marinum]